MRKNAQEAAAVMRPIEDVGLELRFLWNGELHQSQIYRDGGELLGAAREKRTELEARGWGMTSDELARLK